VIEHLTCDKKFEDIGYTIVEKRKKVISSMNRTQIVRRIISLIVLFSVSSNTRVNAGQRILEEKLRKFAGCV
jgi:hypothetical protein